jgi:hypothetical protein
MRCTIPSTPVHVRADIVSDVVLNRHVYTQTANRQEVTQATIFEDGVNIPYVHICITTTDDLPNWQLSFGVDGGTINVGFMLYG